MQAYNDLKAEMENIQQQMAEAKKNECADAIKEVKHRCKGFGFSTRMLRSKKRDG